MRSPCRILGSKRTEAQGPEIAQAMVNPAAIEYLPRRFKAKAMLRRTNSTRIKPMYPLLLELVNGSTMAISSRTVLIKKHSEISIHESRTARRCSGSGIFFVEKSGPINLLILE
jgi:hypothetical protein